MQRKFLMIAGLSRSGKSTLRRALKQHGFQPLSGNDIRDPICAAVEGWDSVNWHRRTGDPEKDQQAIRIARRVLTRALERGDHLAIQDEHFHPSENRGLVLAAVPGGLARGFVMLDIGYEVYRARYERAGEKRRLFSPEDFQHRRTEATLPCVGEGFDKVLCLTVGDPAGPLQAAECAEHLVAATDRKYVQEVFPLLIERITGHWR